ncbi:MAG: Holliday junction resolvase RuvX [Acidimicrobiaceae bacterium]|nr:Holliday junction resolvase RuvX [Acidimicrobiaceae bacterium]
MRILGIDPGTRRCGIAITNSSETMAFPREAIAYDENFVRRVVLLVAEEQVELVVMGRPLSLAGSKTSSTDFADEMFVRLSGALDLPVVQHDERLTTTAAQRSLSSAGIKVKDHRSRIDSAAAVVLLQHFADSRNAL